MLGVTTMGKKPIFSQIILLIIIAVLCIILTVALALWAGSTDDILLDLQELNWANVIPVILIGGFLCCVIVGILILCLGKNIFNKAKDFLSEIDKNGGK